jgi:hypothetical protein
VSWFVVAISLVAYATAGLAIGAATGWLISRLRMGSQQNILNDALLGSLGYVAGFFGCIFMPWPRNTVITQLPGGGTVATTMSRYQHPERVAIVIAMLFPLLYELSRRKNRPGASLT